MAFRWLFPRSKPSPRPRTEAAPDLRALLDAFYATPPTDRPDASFLESALRSGRVRASDATAGLVRVFQEAHEPRFRLPELPPLFLDAGADPNAPRPCASEETATCLRAAVYYGMMTEDTAPAWERAGADWTAAPDGLLPLVFQFRPLSLSEQARSLIALVPYVPAADWARPFHTLRSGCAPRDSWNSLRRTVSLETALHERMLALDQGAGPSAQAAVALARALPPPVLSPPNRPRL